MDRSKPTSWNHLVFTKHAIERMNARRIPREAVIVVMRYGQAEFIDGSNHFVLRRKDILKYMRINVDLRQYEGIEVVCNDREIVTVYRRYEFLQQRTFFRRQRPAWQ